MPYAREIGMAMTLGVMPERGGLWDQEAPFVDALDIVLGEQLRRAAGVKPKGARQRRST